MKLMNRKKILLIFLIVFINSLQFVQGQNPATQLANHIADKMKDTLNLTNQKRNQIFAINMYLHNRKMIVRQRTANPELVRAGLQRVEHMRDSMYQTILPSGKYQIYLQKKRFLVTSN